MHKLHRPEWREILSQNFTRLESLVEFLELSEEQSRKLLSRSRFPLNLPYRLAYKIEKGTLDDPLLRQFVPMREENLGVAGFSEDPVGDLSFRSTSKLLHKYEGRVLIVTTGVCAMHCRYCFRQNFEYDRGNKSFDREIDWISENRDIHEVILSGGDPLSLSNEVLGELIEKLNRCEHIKKIRFHSRFPIGIPERIDEELLGILQGSSSQIVFVIHVNHPRELDVEVLDALKKLYLRGAILLSQSVLLKGVNDSVEVLFKLCNDLVNNGILPYYLHQLDRVQGASHFEVSEVEGKHLIAELTKRLPGYAVPKYVREVEGEASKVSV